MKVSDGINEHPSPSVDQAMNDARDHLAFPLVDAAEILDRGPAVYTKGEGVRLTDVHGHVYLDMVSGFTRANTLGYGNEEIAKAIYDQARTLHYAGTSGNVTYPAIQLAKD